MASRAVVPRFLLPLQSPLWRGVRVPVSPSAVRVRYAASSSSAGKPHKPITLEQPAKFNPPSHGSRLRRGGSPLPKHYGPELTATERARQRATDYPGLMPPEGTWAHWFWTSQLLHTVITMGTLFVLGIFTVFLNYAHNSPFKDLVPPISDLWAHPGYYFTAWRNVVYLHQQNKGRETQEARYQHVDDVAKRKYFRKMHGIEEVSPISIYFGRDKRQSDEELEAEVLGLEPPPRPAEEDTPRRKWFGIF